MIEVATFEECGLLRRVLGHADHYLYFSVSHQNPLRRGAVFNPASGELAMVWLIGSHTLIFDLIMIVLAFQLRGLPQRLEQLSQA